MQSTTMRGLSKLARRAPPQVRRHASSSHGHEHAAPANESFGKGFYLSLALIPFTYAIWTASRPDASGAPTALTAALAKYSAWRDEWARRNALHTRMVEQAGHDRNLFINSPGPQYVDLRFPEALGNPGSPLNTHVGIKPDLSQVQGELQRRQREGEEKKLKELGW